MVGFNPNLKRQLTKKEYAAAGSVTGIITRGLSQPLDVIKIRFQLQTEPISSHSRIELQSKYSGIIQAVQCIIQEERLGALWKGHVPAQVLSVLYGVGQFCSFEILTRFAWTTLPPHFRSSSWQPWVHSTCGGLAGCIATVISFPCDMLRTRLVGQGKVRVYVNIRHAVSHIYATEGPRAFFKGLTPALIAIAPYAGAQFGFYKFLSHKYKKYSNIKGGELSGTGSLLCGGMAGMASKALVYPLDLMKKRMEVQGFEEARKHFGKTVMYRGFLHCGKRIISEEGFLALFKGLSPSILKAAVTTGLHFAIYEQTCRLMRYV